MAEKQLIYGNTIREFGAVGDGVTDDTAAFEKAFSGMCSLLCIPYGTYKITRPLTVAANIRIDCHRRARINFAGLSAAKDACRITVTGGIWNCVDTELCAFDFTGAKDVTLRGLTAYSASDCILGLCDCRGIHVESVHFGSEHTASGVLAGGECSLVTLDGVECTGCVAAIEFAPGAAAELWFVRSLRSESCAHLVSAQNAELKNMRFSRLEGHVSDCAVSLNGCTLEEIAFVSLTLHDGYLKLTDSRFTHFTVEDFTRLADMEADAGKPTLELVGSDCTLLCDGVSLDAVILAKKAAPNLKLTAARMASPLPNAYRYTAEVTLAADTRFTLPAGGFEALAVSGVNPIRKETQSNVVHP